MLPAAVAEVSMECEKFILRKYHFHSNEASYSGVGD